MENIIREVCLKHSKKIPGRRNELKNIDKRIIKKLYENSFHNIIEIMNKINEKDNDIKNFLKFNKLENGKILNEKLLNESKEQASLLLNKIELGIYEIEKSTHLKNEFIMHLLRKQYIKNNELQKINFITNSGLSFFLKDLSDAINEENNKIDDKEKIILLESEVQKLRSSLILLESEKSDFEEENEMLKEKYEAEALIDVFKSMNSEEYDYLLDNFLKNNLMLKTLKKEGFVIPVEVESMVISQKVFMKFLKKNQIREIEKIGKELELMVEESNAYNYSGSEFLEKEKKNVIIETSGWKLGDKIISQPKVKEVINDEQK